VLIELLLISQLIMGDEPKKKLSIISRAILHGGNASDLATTIHALDKPNVNEANPILGTDPSTLKLSLIKAGTSIGTDLLLSRLSKTHPKLANGMAKGLGIGMMLVAAHNLNTSRK